MNVEEAIETLKSFANLDEDIELKQAIETVLKELEDNRADLTTVYIKGVCDEKIKWRDKIREEIKKLDILLELIEADKYNFAKTVLQELLDESEG